MQFTSTRTKTIKVNSPEGLIKGLSHDGGLFVPTTFPNIKEFLYNSTDKTYTDIAKHILGLFFDEFSTEDISTSVDSAYINRFDTKDTVKLTDLDDNSILELYHGPTLAFKDMALSVMPHLLTKAIQKTNLNKEVVILTATSGDTGKAALEGYKNIDGIKIIVFFPEDGVSDVQKLQMKTQEGNNVKVIGIKGNFDDAQTGVKKIFENDSLAKLLNENGFIFSSANSINIGRLIPQIVYYVHSYIKLYSEGKIKKDEKINFVVPTGNFGNILAGYYAKLMGLPINKLICASNDNNVLYEFFKTGVYNKNKDLILTTSPSMDILVSSNLERLLFETCNRDANLISDLMDQLKTTGKYEITDIMKNNLNDFDGFFANKEQVSTEIKNVFDKFNYLMDTHTAVAYNCYKQYVNKTNDNSYTVILSTASPYKFVEDVMKPLNNTVYKDVFECSNALSVVSNTKIPSQITSLKTALVTHTDVIEKNELEKSILKYLNLTK